MYINEQKQKILELFHAKDWNASRGNVSIIGDWKGEALYVFFNKYSETEVLSFDLARLERLLARLPELDAEARELLKKEPLEDVQELIFSGLSIGREYAFSLGYNTGDSSARPLYLYVTFDWSFQPDPEIIYEFY